MGEAVFMGHSLWHCSSLCPELALVVLGLILLRSDGMGEGCTCGVLKSICDADGAPTLLICECHWERGQGPPPPPRPGPWEIGCELQQCSCPLRNRILKGVLGEQVLVTADYTQVHLSFPGEQGQVHTHCTAVVSLPGRAAFLKKAMCLPQGPE